MGSVPPGRWRTPREAEGGEPGQEWPFKKPAEEDGSGRYGKRERDKARKAEA